MMIPRIIALFFLVSQFLVADTYFETWDLGFKIKVNEGFNISYSSPELNRPFLFIKKDGGGYPNINIVLGGWENQPDNHFNKRELHINQLKRSLKSFTLIESNKFIFQESRYGLKLEYSFLSQSGNFIKQEQYHFLVNSYYLIVTGTTLQNSSNEAIEQTVKSIKSLH